MYVAHVRVCSYDAAPGGSGIPTYLPTYPTYLRDGDMHIYIGGQVGTAKCRPQRRRR